MVHSHINSIVPLLPTTPEDLGCFRHHLSTGVFIDRVHATSRKTFGTESGTTGSFVDLQKGGTSCTSKPNIEDHTPKKFQAV